MDKSGQMGSLSPEQGASVLIIEPHADGHHGPYLEWMASGLAERGFRITIATTPESLEHASFRALGKFDEKIRIVPMSGLSHETTDHRWLGLIARELSYWRFFKKCYKDLSTDVRPDVVFLPYLDYCLYAIGLLGSPFEDRPWVGLAMRLSFHYREMDVIAPRPALANIKKKLFLRMLRNRLLRSLLTIDEPLADYLVGHGKADDKVTFFPEPVGWTDLPNRNEARDELNLSLERTLILVYGAITERKGVVKLLRAMASPAFPASVDVLLAGKQSPEIRELVREPWTTALLTEGRLICLDRFIDGREERCLFGAADIVWLGYRGHYTPSGVLAQAAAAGRPIIACKEGIIGWQAERHKLGALVSPAQVNEIIDGINALINREDLHEDRLPSWHYSDISTACELLSNALNTYRHRNGTS